MNELYEPNVFLLGQPFAECFLCVNLTLGSAKTWSTLGRLFVCIVCMSWMCSEFFYPNSYSWVSITMRRSDYFRSAYTSQPLAVCLFVWSMSWMYSELFRPMGIPTHAMSKYNHGMKKLLSFSLYWVNPWPTVCMYELYALNVSLKLVCTLFVFMNATSWMCIESSHSMDSHLHDMSKHKTWDNNNISLNFLNSLLEDTTGSGLYYCILTRRLLR